MSGGGRMTFGWTGTSAFAPRELGEVPVVEAEVPAEEGAEGVEAEWWEEGVPSSCDAVLDSLRLEEGEPVRRKLN